MQGFLISILAWNNWWKLSHVIVITDAILKPVKSNFSAHFGNNHSCIKNVITKAVLQTLENDPPSWKYIHSRTLGLSVVVTWKLKLMHELATETFVHK